MSRRGAYWRSPVRKNRGGKCAPSRIAPVERLHRVLPPSDLAALRLGAGARLRMLVRVRSCRANTLETWVCVDGGDWTFVGRWTRTKIPRELSALAKARGWGYESGTTSGDDETFDEVFARKAAHVGPNPAGTGEQ